jgi:hypothetical protein
MNYAESALSVPVIIALIQMLKTMGLPSKWAPLLSIILGIGGNFLFKFAGYEWQTLLVSGLVAGLAASGLYDLGKAPVSVLAGVFPKK